MPWPCSLLGRPERLELRLAHALVLEAGGEQVEAWSPERVVVSAAEMQTHGERRMVVLCLRDPRPGIAPFLLVFDDTEQLTELREGPQPFGWIGT
jgi:hypothetical protein